MIWPQWRRQLETVGRRLHSVRVEGVEGAHMTQDLLEIPRNGIDLVLFEGETSQRGRVGDIFGADRRHPADVSTACGDPGVLRIAPPPGEGYGAARI